jgi:hypothetical protein
MPRFTTFDKKYLFPFFTGKNFETEIENEMMQQQELADIHHDKRYALVIMYWNVSFSSLVIWLLLKRATARTIIHWKLRWNRITGTNRDRLRFLWTTQKAMWLLRFDDFKVAIFLFANLVLYVFILRIGFDRILTSMDLLSYMEDSDWLHWIINY